MVSYVVRGIKRIISNRSNISNIINGILEIKGKVYIYFFVFQELIQRIFRLLIYQFQQLLPNLHSFSDQMIFQERKKLLALFLHFYH